MHVTRRVVSAKTRLRKEHWRTGLDKNPTWCKVLQRDNNVNQVIGSAENCQNSIGARVDGRRALNIRR